MNKLKTIAYFPLNVSLLPGEDLPLRIFEPKYKQLITECEMSGESFGIPFMKTNEMQSYGSEVKIKQIVAKNSKGEMVIVAEGVANFELVSYQNPFPGKLYSGGKINIINNDQPLSNGELLKVILRYTKKYDPEFLKGVKGNEILLNDVAKALNLSSEDKFKFISLTGQENQEKLLMAQLNYLSKLREQEKLLNNDYYLN
jgi:Lon protease-like protein